MDMTVNRLPARTWNWLKMNETVLSSVEPFRQQEIPEGNIFREENETEQNIFREIETGMGPDMDQLGENSAAARHRFRERKYDGCAGDRKSHAGWKFSPLFPSCGERQYPEGRLSFQF